MLSKYILLAASLLAATGVAANTKIYAYVDADGVKHFTDVPDSRLYKLIHLSPQELTQSGQRYDAGWRTRAAQFDSIIEAAAVAAAIEPNLLRAVIVVESGFNPRAVSKRGAMGLMQLMPATGSRFGAADLFDPRDNVNAGARYLKTLMTLFRRDVHLVLAAYNAGENAVQRSGGRIPPYSETQAYVPRVLKIYRDFGDSARATQARNL